MKDLPFDAYDFFGYMASGLVVLITMDLVVGFPTVLGQDFKVVDTFALILGAYVAGQLVATPAKALLEYGLVDKLLGRPSVTLLDQERPRFLPTFFRDYFKPMPEQTRAALLARVGQPDKSGDALFLHIRFAPEVRTDEALMRRLGGFLNKYGFARNLAFTSFAAGLALLVKGLAGNESDLVRYGSTAVVVAVLLTYRYLKFLRQYSYELFNAYARM